ncbi:MAG: hypothetical protein V1709_00165 [Planctomycetota bacterium]
MTSKDNIDNNCLHEINRKLDRLTGLFDTKAGITLKTAKSKAEGLSYYIQKENEKGKKLFGGIVTNTDSKNYKGAWMYFDKPIAEWREDDLGNWMMLEL